LVADEPTGNLDTKSANAIIDLFEQLTQKGKTVVMVTHDPSLTSRTTRNIIIVDGELVDETVARCLPRLRHRHLLEFTKLAEERIYQANETIVPRNAPVEHFFMIRKGEVEVVLKDPRNSDVVISSLGPGDYFGEIELMGEGMSIANVRAGSAEPVELLVLQRSDFTRVIEESPITAELIEKVVQQRLEEHRALDRRQAQTELLRK
jgi:CRP-like cAMP-binding protein